MSSLAETSNEPPAPHDEGRGFCLLLAKAEEVRTRIGEVARAIEERVRRVLKDWPPSRDNPR